MNDATMKSTVVKKHDPYAPTGKLHTPTPLDELESLALPDQYGGGALPVCGQAAAELKRLRASNAKLVAALREAREMIEHGPSSSTALNRALAKIDAALKNAETGK